MAPYIPHGTQDFILADLTDYYPADITALSVQACLLPPNTDPTTEWAAASWHPDKAATIAYEYPGDLAEGWYFLWSRINQGREYRHGRVRLI